MRNEALERAKFTLKQELRALKGLESLVRRSLPRAVSLIKSRRGKIILTGVGKSGYIAMKTAGTFVSLGHPAVFLHPVEALHGDSGVVSDGDVVIAISFSGRSPEIIKIVKYLRKAFLIKVISIVGSAKAELARLSDAVLVISIEEEGCPIGLAPMASTTATLVVGDLLASAVTSPRNFRKSHFAKFHPGGSLGLTLGKVKDHMTSGRDLPLVSQTATFDKTLREMNDKRLGIVGVVDSRWRLVGIVTDGDVRRFLVKKGNISRARAKDVMTISPKYVREFHSLEGALAMMEEYRITSLFVVGNGRRPVGIIHIHDIMEDAVIRR
ncbi:KpsF/GutQ family sugar-phosphate isomerase [Patescibacteria group bacterium]|nr:MAG: KpsF/GutQ family sugar-phosphate isomerase [Patescibacteria group bacterium]